MSEPITATASVGRTLEEYLAAAKQKGNNAVGKDAFLQLLVTQLKYQNPLEPMQDTEFIAQLAQFSSLEQLQNLNTNMTTGHAYGMVGKYVYAEVRDENGQTAPVFGIVDRVVSSNGMYYLQVGENVVPLDRVSEVYDSTLFQGQTLLEVSGLIDRTVTAKITGSDETITGVVDGVKVENGVIYALIGEEQVPISAIINIQK